MNRTHGEWTDRLSDYLAESLEGDDLTALERHLAECGECRGVLEDLRRVVSRAGGLGNVQPPRDLWPGIAAAIKAPVQALRDAGNAKVIALPTAVVGERASGTRERLAFTRTQLAAASVALIAVSALTTWWAGPGLGVRSEAPSLPQTPSAVTMAAAVAAPPKGLAAELSALEAALASASAQLDPNTVRVLQRNLGVIEQAIEDSRRALAVDPGNDFLTDHLDQVYERKLEYLRDAVRIVEWVS